MHKLVLMPHDIVVFLPNGCQLTELEFELRGRPSIRFGCKAGACGACVIEVLQGGANLSEKSADENSFLLRLGHVGDEFRLACQCRLNGEVTIRAASSKFHKRVSYPVNERETS